MSENDDYDPHWARSDAHQSKVHDAKGCVWAMGVVVLVMLAVAAAVELLS